MLVHKIGGTAEILVEVDAVVKPTVPFQDILRQAVDIIDRLALGYELHNLAQLEHIYGLALFKFHILAGKWGNRLCRF